MLVPVLMHDRQLVGGIVSQNSDTRGALVPIYFPLKKIILFFLNLLVIYDTISIREPPKVS
jgi:hypothetical protein